MADVYQIVCPRCAATNRLPVERDPDTAKCGACHVALFNGQPAEVDTAVLERHLRGNDIPVLLDVWAPWCGPCRSMAPAFARAAMLLEPGIRLLKLNADTAPDMTARLQVQGIPALLLFHRGEVLARTAGAMNANHIVAWARRHAAMAETVPGAKGFE